LAAPPATAAINSLRCDITGRAVALTLLTMISVLACALVIHRRVDTVRGRAYLLVALFTTALP